MTFNVAINGYGRIGQSLLRAIYEDENRLGLKVVAINSLTDIETLTYMTRYDTTHGRFPVCVDHNGMDLLVNGDAIKVYHEQEPEGLDWQDLNIDLLFECSGSFSSRDMAERYLARGPKKFLFSQPAESDVDATIVFGINQNDLNMDQRVVSAASCTTNCVVPILDVLDREWGVENGLMTTIHSAMNDQPMIDSSSETNLRLSRSGLQSIIPVETSLAKGIERLLPHLTGKFDCLHVRVPTMNVSAMDISINLSKPTDIQAINNVLKKATEGKYSGLMNYTEEPHASVDFNHDPHSCIVDATQTRVNSKTMVKLFCWFDNEWGFANRMLDVAKFWLHRS